VSEPDADLDHYRALLRDADDEPKRVGLIQLLIDEGARDRLAAQRKPVAAEPLLERQPFLPPVPMRPEGSLQEAMRVNASQGLGETKIAAAADDVSMKFADLAARLRAREPELPPLPSQPPEPKPRSESLERPGPQDAAEQFEGDGVQPSLPSSAAPSPKTAAGAIPPIFSEPSPADDLIDKISNLLSRSVAPAKAVPAVTTASSSVARPPDNHAENSIASQIQAALADRLEEPRPQNVAKHLDDDEAQQPLPLSKILPEGANAGTITSISPESSSTNDLVDRIAKLLSSRPAMATSSAKIESSLAASPSGNGAENSLASQISAVSCRRFDGHQV
jgi:hypothetical protein